MSIKWISDEFAFVVLNERKVFKYTLGMKYLDSMKAI